MRSCQVPPFWKFGRKLNSLPQQKKGGGGRGDGAHFVANGRIPKGHQFYLSFISQTKIMSAFWTRQDMSNPPCSDQATIKPSFNSSNLQPWTHFTSIFYFYTSWKRFLVYQVTSVSSFGVQWVKFWISVSVKLAKNNLNESHYALNLSDFISLKSLLGQFKDV